MKIIFFSLFVLATLISFSQDDNVVTYKDGKTDLYGLKNKTTKEKISKAIYSSIEPFYEHSGKTNLFMVSTVKQVAKNGKLLDEFNYFIINNKGERISRHTVKNSWNVEEKGHIVTMAYYNYENHSKFRGRRYHIDRDCNCIPEPYFPCPTRVPMDTASSSEVLKDIQKLEFIVEFKSIASGLIAVDKLIEKNPKEPQYLFYKAWLLFSGFETLIHRHEEQDHHWSETHLTNHYNELPLIVWEPSDLGFTKTTLKQKDVLNSEIKKLSRNWYQNNKIDIDDFCFTQECGEALFIVENDRYLDSLAAFNFVHRDVKIAQLIEVYDLLERTKRFTQDDPAITLIINVWQYNILHDDIKPIIERKREIARDLKGNISELYDKGFYTNETYEGPFISAHFKTTFPSDNKYGPVMNYGFRFGYSSHETVDDNKDHERGRLELGLDLYLGDHADYLGISVGGGATSGKIEFYPVEFTYTSKSGDVASLGYRPELGIKLGPIHFTGGYHFIKKTKFPELRGPQVGLVYSTFLFKAHHYNIKHPHYSNLFDF